MKIGQLLLLRQDAKDRLWLPTTATYKGIETSGRFPFTKTWFLVEETYPLGDQIPKRIGYETLTLLLEDYEIMEGRR